MIPLRENIVDGDFLRRHVADEENGIQVQARIPVGPDGDGLNVLSQMRFEQNRLVIVGTTEKLLAGHRKNHRGNEYDRGMRELINNNIGRYLNITLMVDEVLGWNQKKKEAILGSSSKASGNITKEHVQAINQHLLNIYGNLSAIELVADSDSSSSSDSSEATEA